MPKKAILVVVAMMCSASSFAVPRLDAKEIIVNPITTSLRATVQMDAKDNLYTPGGQAKISVHVNQNAYVYLFDINEKGKVHMIVPNKITGKNAMVIANTARTFPSPNENYKLSVAKPYGTNKILLIASKTPLDLSRIASYRNAQSNFADVYPKIKGQKSFAKMLSVVVNPPDQSISQNSWVSAHTFYKVISR